LTIRSSAPGVCPEHAEDRDDHAYEGDRISVAVADEVAHISIGSGVRRNALRTADWNDLAAIANGLSARSDVKVVVCRGVAGNFSSGSDLSEWRSVDPAYVNHTFAAMESALVALESLDVVTVAAIEGLAAGAGCELALACDLQVMARSALIGMPIVRLGIRTSPRFALRLVEAVGATRARHLLFTGRLIGAEQAEGWGLVSELADDAQFDFRLRRLVDSVVSQPRSSLVAAKSSTSRALADVRSRQCEPGWDYIDPAEFFDRVANFLDRRVWT
jgi:enoyl-CoA hydratase